MGNVASLAVAIGVPIVTGAIEGQFIMKDIKGWYKTLKKPKWTPPNWLFGPAWSVLYVSTGVASWLVFKHGGSKRSVPLTLYAIQLALNFAWTPLFFKAHKLDLATVDSAAMLGVATAATVTMAKAAKPELVAPLMAPYLAWVAFATALSFEICRTNPEERAIKGKGDAEKKAKKAKKEVSQAAGDAQRGAQNIADRIVAEAKTS